MSFDFEQVRAEVASLSAQISNLIGDISSQVQQMLNDPAREERRAWDMFAAARASGADDNGEFWTVGACSDEADLFIAERRKRFGGGR